MKNHLTSEESTNLKDRLNQKENEDRLCRDKNSLKTTKKNQTFRKVKSTSMKEEQDVKIRTKTQENQKQLLEIKYMTQRNEKQQELRKWP